MKYKTLSIVKLPFSVIFLIIFLSCQSEPLIHPLDLEKALPVEYTEVVELSGLVGFEDTLFTVSDDHDHTIFRIELHEDHAVLKPYLHFNLLKADSNDRLDFEGITCDSKGNFYIVSETQQRILFVSKNGKTVEWFSESLYSWGYEKGLFQVENAFLEGITLIEQDKQFVLTAEREPRGIITLNIIDDEKRIKVIKCDQTDLEFPQNRPPDFTGLHSENGDIYVLQRGTHCISKIDILEDKIEETNFWSYSIHENSEELKYSDASYGHGEGLWMDKNFVYVIFDNGGDFRVSDSTDNRPLLFIMKRPEE